jgi:hypothetical protein
MRRANAANAGKIACLDSSLFLPTHAKTEKISYCL